MPYSSYQSPYGLSLQQAPRNCEEKWDYWRQWHSAAYRAGERGTYSREGEYSPTAGMRLKKATDALAHLERECPGGSPGPQMPPYPKTASPPLLPWSHAPVVPSYPTAPRPLPSTVTAGPARVPWWGWLLGGGMLVLVLSRGRT